MSQQRQARNDAYRRLESINQKLMYLQEEYQVQRLVELEKMESKQQRDGHKRKRRRRRESGADANQAALLDDDGDLNVPIAQKLNATRQKKEEALEEYQDQQLLYSILLMNAYYQEMPWYMEQKKKKYKQLMQHFSKHNVHYH